MSRSLIERRLMDVAARLRGAREELAVLDEQLAAFDDAAEEARLRSLVSETPMAQREYADARRHADAMARTKRLLVSQISELAANQDELLDRLIATPGAARAEKERW